MTDEEDLCVEIHQQSDQCEFVTLHCDDGELLDYLRFYYCTLTGGWKSIGVPLLFVWAIFLLSLLASTADMFFVPTLDKISCKLRLSQAVAGITLIALGNGAPDVITAYSVMDVSQDLPLLLGALIGATYCVLTLVLGVTIFANNSPIPIKPAGFYRDLAAYWVLFITNVVICYNGQITWFEAVLYFAVYLCYVLVVVILDRRKSEPRPLDISETDPLLQRSRSDLESTDGFAGVGGDASLHPRWSEDGGASPAAHVDEVFVGSHTSKSPATWSLMGSDRGALDTSIHIHDFAEAAELTDDQEEFLPPFLEPPDGSASVLAIAYWICTWPFTFLRCLTIPTVELAGQRYYQRRRWMLLLSPTLAFFLVTFATLGAKSITHSYPFFSANLPLWLIVCILGLATVVLFLVLEIVITAASCAICGRPGSWGQMVRIREPSVCRSCRALSMCVVRDHSVRASGTSPLRFGPTEGRPIPVSSLSAETVRKHEVEAMKLGSSVGAGGSLAHDGFEHQAGLGHTHRESCGNLSDSTSAQSASEYPLPRRSTVTMDLSTLNQWPIYLVSFVMSIVWMRLIGGEVVACLIAMGKILDVSTVILGLTVVALGNSIGDVITSLVVARQGLGEMAVASCFGSPLFSEALGIGTAMSYWCFKHWPDAYEVDIHSKDFSRVKMLWWFIGGTLILNMAVFRFSNFSPPPLYGLLLCMLYFVFIAVAIAVELDYL
eukprot:Rmarinus@m.3235